MALLVGIVVVAISLVIAFFLGAKFGLRSAVDAPDLASDAVRVANDQRTMLDTWRREIANILVWENPDRYLDLYRTLHGEVSAYSGMKPEVLRAKLGEMCAKYPRFEDFDAMSTRTHVLYPEAREIMSSEDLAEKFSEITRFLAMQRATNSNWQFVKATSDDDLDHLVKYVSKIKDTKFRLRLERAISDYYVWCADSDRDGDVFEYGHVVVQPVSHFAETRYGIYLKDTNEFGLYGLFHANDERIFHSFYRSDNSFREEKRLDYLHAVAEEFRKLTLNSNGDSDFPRHERDSA